MKSKNGGIIGSSISTMAAFILVLLILALFTFASLTINKINGANSIFNKNLLTINAGEENVLYTEYGQRLYLDPSIKSVDSLGIINYSVQKRNNQKLLEFLKTKTKFYNEQRDMLDILVLWGNTINEDVIKNDYFIREINHASIKPTRLELNKDERVICEKRTCYNEKEKSLKMNHEEFEEQITATINQDPIAYKKLNLTKISIVYGNSIPSANNPYYE